jgi:hypothetical protein
MRFGLNAIMSHCLIKASFTDIHCCMVLKIIILVVVPYGKSYEQAWAVGMNGTCLTVRKWYGTLLPFIEPYTDLFHFYCLSFIHLTVSVISKFWIYCIKESLFSNYRCRNYHFTIQFYCLITKFSTFKQVTDGKQALILPFVFIY